MTTRLALRAASLLAALTLAAACGDDDEKATRIETATVERRTITVDAQATGVIEPINIVEVKSKASGIITRMSVETGMQVKPGDLLAQIDTRDVQNQYSQADADLQAANARREVAVAQKRRSDEMFAQRVITAQEHETAALDYANAQAQLVRARASLDQAKQRLEDATVSAPVAGTIIERTVSLGQVITSATGGAAAGTTLLKMADLDRVRVRALFNETDIGTVSASQNATVVVDAYPDRRFTGLVEKVEPQAVVQQGVTMFPVLVTLDNREGLLKPGMNGEVSVLIQERQNVIAVPNDAIRNTREGALTAPLLGLDPDSVQAQIQLQMGAGGGMRGAGRRTGTSGGDVEVALPQQGQDRGQRGQQVQVTDAQCAEVTAAFAKKPAEKKKLDDLMVQLRSGGDMQALRGEMQAIYAAVGVDARVAGACRRRESGAQRPAAAGAAPARGTAPAAGAPGAGSAPRAANGAPAQLQAPGEFGAPGPRTRPGLVFVAEGGTYKPRIVRLGAGNFDYTEVVSGLKEGEEVVLLAALSLQAQRTQQQDQIRSRMGGGVPGMQQQGGGAGGGGGGGAPRGGGGGRP
jgi:HlyD family secretion protein